MSLINENLQKAFDELNEISLDKYKGTDDEERELRKYWMFDVDRMKLSFTEEAGSDIQEAVKNIFIKYLGPGESDDRS